MSKKQPTERALRSIKVDEKLNVKITFVEDVVNDNPGEGETMAIENEYTVKAK